jgi:hypothetical protein
MPVDRKLALQTLKKYDKELYYVCARIEEIGNYLASNPDLRKRFEHYMFSLRVLDELEKEGVIEIINDYEQGDIFVRKRQFRLFE